MKLALALIRHDGGTQARAELDHDAVDTYAQAMVAGATFPPVIVFYDGAEYWLADGFHRRLAASAANLTEIDVDVRQGTQRDAVLFSVGANAVHGVRRTAADKRRAVLRLLEDAEWCAWSDREIAKRCGVSHTFVAGERRRLTGNVASEPRKFVTKHGTAATMAPAARGNGCQAAVATVATAPTRDAPSAPPSGDPMAEAARLERAFVAIVDQMTAAPQRVRFALSVVVDDYLPKLQRLARTEAA